MTVATQSPQVQPVKNKAGQPTKYRTEFVEIARNMTRAGVTREDLAVQLGCNQATLHAWMNKYPDFYKAIKEERLVADTIVASALYKRAVGYTRKVKKPVTWQGVTEIVEIDEEVPPDVVAAQFWLKNRQPGIWRDRQEITGADGKEIQVSLSWLDNRQVTIDVDAVQVQDVQDVSRPGKPQLENPLESTGCGE